MNLYPPPLKNSFANQMFFSRVWEQWFYSLKAVIDNLISNVTDLQSTYIIASGVATLVGGTATVNNSLISATNNVLITVQSLGTVSSPTPICVTSKVSGTSFTITSSDATDTSTIFWAIVE